MRRAWVANRTILETETDPVRVALSLAISLTLIIQSSTFREICI